MVIRKNNRHKYEIKLEKERNKLRIDKKNYFLQ